MQSVGWVVGSWGRGQESSLPLHGFFKRARVIMGIGGLPLTISSTRNHLFLQSAFTRAWILLVIAGHPLTIPSTRNHLFLLYGVFKRARIILGIVGLPVTIPSTRNHLFLHQKTFNRARIMLSIACLPWLFHPPGMISFLSMAPRSCLLLLAFLLLLHQSGFISFSYSMSSTGPLAC